MFKLYIQTLLLGYACHVHQTRTVGTGYESGTGLHVPLNLVQSHLRADGCLLHREHTSKAAALIRALGLQYLNAVNQVQQVLDLIKGCHMLLTGRTQAQLSDTVTGVVQAHLMGEGAEWMIYLDHIVQELHHVHNLA